MRTCISSTTWDQLQFLTKAFSDQQVRFVIHLNGRLDEKILEHAVQETMQALPILRCRYVEKRRRPIWQIIPELEIQHVFSIREATNPETEIQRALLENIDPLAGPILRVTLIRSWTDTICINLDHTAGDASSIRFFAYLLSSYYRRLQKDALYAAQTDRMRTRSFGSILKRFSLPEKAKLFRQSLSFPKTEATWKFPWNKSGTIREKKILLRKLSHEKSIALLHYAACSHSWPNDIILAAYFRSLHSVISPKAGTPLKITVPIDMRTYLPAKAKGQIANITSSFDAMIPRIGKDYLDTLALVKQEMKTKRECSPGMAALFLLAPALKLLPYSWEKKLLLGGKVKLSPPPPWFIHLGTIQAQRLAFGDTQVEYAYPLQSISRPPHIFQLGVSRFENDFTFSVCFFGDNEEERHVNHFLDLLEKELHDAPGTD